MEIVYFGDNSLCKNRRMIYQYITNCLVGGLDSFIVSHKFLRAETTYENLLKIKLMYKSNF